MKLKMTLEGFLEDYEAYPVVSSRETLAARTAAHLLHVQVTEALESGQLMRTSETPIRQKIEAFRQSVEWMDAFKQYEPTPTATRLKRYQRKKLEDALHLVVAFELPAKRS